MRVVGNGRKTRFWEDKWLGDKSLAELYPRLYNLSFSKNITVENVLVGGWYKIQLRRTLCGETMVMWESIKSKCAGVKLSETEDGITWMLNSNGKFSV